MWFFWFFIFLFFTKHLEKINITTINTEIFAIFIFFIEIVDIRENQHCYIYNKSGNFYFLKFFFKQWEKQKFSTLSLLYIHVLRIFWFHFICTRNKKINFILSSSVSLSVTQIQICNNIYILIIYKLTCSKITDLHYDKLQ